LSGDDVAFGAGSQFILVEMISAGGPFILEFLRESPTGLLAFGD
jgi:hypothetical protein